jgi:predicted HAD superfamily Cof-like phosphohydrolase
MTNEIIDLDDDQMTLPFEDKETVDRGNMVREFMSAFQASEDPELWKKLMAEELQEVREAMAQLLKELIDLEYVSTGAYLVGVREVDPEMAKVLGQINNIASIIPLDVFNEAFARVHASNMSKLDRDGKPIRREDGKILKGPNYMPPDLIDLI